MSCYIDMKLWLNIHVLTTLFFELMFVYIYIILWFICVFFFISHPRWYYIVHDIVVNNWFQTYEEQEHERYLYAIRLLKNEFILIFFYIFFAFMYTRFGLAHCIITSMTFHRWLIEASFAPLAFSCSFIGYHTGIMENFSDILQMFYILGFMLKIPLFFFMRVAESKSDCVVNDMKVSFFRILCKLPSE